MTYRLFIEKSAQKSLDKINNPSQDKIINAIQNLSKDQKPSGVKKLSGRDAWRIRIGNHRVIYEIDDKQQIILVVDIGHRKDIYRK